MITIENSIIDGFKIYELSEESEVKLWHDCLFVFDSSALLNIYLYSEKTKQDIIENIFKPSQQRLWIPHQVLFEFLKNKEKTSSKTIDRYNTLITENLAKISKLHNDINGQITTLKEQTSRDITHPYVEQDDITNLEKEFSESVTKFNTNFRKKVDAKVKEMKTSLQADILFDAIKLYFKTAEGHSFSEILELVHEGKERYKFCIPPGYMDFDDKAKKKGTQIFGDLIIWKQILKAACDYHSNVIFINDDGKEDWWDIEFKDTKKPRRELIKEFNDQSKKQFWMYDLTSFLFKANQIFNSQISQEEIEAVSELSEEEKGKVYSVLIDNKWVLNHWGSRCAKLDSNKIIFSGESAPSGDDGCHLDVFGVIEKGRKYKISCIAKASENTKGSFMLWCHNHLGDLRDISVSTEYKTPSTQGEIIHLFFTPVKSDHIRIHLQYKPGNGSIEVSDVKILQVD